MMSLLSENPGADVEAPLAAIELPLRMRNPEMRKRDVARLEFYPVGWQGVEVLNGEIAPVEDEARVKAEEAAFDARLQSQAEEMATRMDVAQREAITAARATWEAELVERVAIERSVIQQVCERFGRERARYFAGVEAEVVKLALAIASRVLHREAQLDPLLLTAVVRVALEKVAEDSGAMLRVPAKEIEAWRGVFEDADASVKLVGDEQLSAGECVLETRVGTVELGVTAQLAEIERGFFDLLQQRPA